MPNRIIKESICESYGLSECSLFASDLYKRLITYADDYGRFNSDTMIMRARLYPREYETVTEEDIVDGLAELAGVGKLSFYRARLFNQGGKTGVYGAFPNWGEHQRVRESKAKCPDPEDTDVNDWYLRRFIPIDMRVEIIERDGFKCKICGKFLTSCREAKRFVKLGQGLYNIDHIVPVLQGGRATSENLRLTCPECNLKRKKKFTFREILSLSNSPQVAESCGELPPESESNPNTNTNPNPNTRKTAPAPRGQYGWVKLTDEQYQKLVAEYGEAETKRCIDYVDESAQSTGNKNKWSDWNLVVRKCHRDGWGKKPVKTFGMQKHEEKPDNRTSEQKTADNMARMRRMLDSVKEGENG